MTVPTTEPTSVRAGDTWEWTRDYGDYPASVWTLTYILISATQKISIQADADGDTHSVSVAPATTAAYTPERCTWTSLITDGTDRYTVDTGVIEIEPDLSAVSSYDGRTHARIMLEAIDAILEGRATDGDLDVVKTNTASHSTDWNPAQLMDWRRLYAAKVKSEDDADAIARGEKRGFVQMRF